MFIQGRDYSFSKTEDGITYLVDGKDGREYREHSFYKYYALDKYSVDALTHLYLYATHPNQFNDPFDCAEDLIEFDDMESVSIFWESLYTKIDSICKHNENAIMRYTQKAYKTYLYMKWGVLCLSRNNYDLSMWSSYCHHTGFCIEFDISKLPCKTVGPFPINYQKELKSLSVKEISLQLATIIQTNIKQKCWEHEQEWRLLIECPKEFYMEPFGEGAFQLKQASPDYHERKFKYTLGCLKSVCLGIKFFNGIHSVITDSGYEFVANNKLQNDVLSFLALSKIPTYILDNEEFKLIRRSIEIIKIRDNAYHIYY